MNRSPPDCVMFATGRDAERRWAWAWLTAGRRAGLERAQVDGRRLRDNRSACDSIYAVGDVTDRVQLTPGRHPRRAMPSPRRFSTPTRPLSTMRRSRRRFSSTPELGTVGLTEAEARERCRAVDIYKASFRPMKLTLTERDEKMLIKLVVDGESGVVLGCHLMGPDSGELIQVLGILVKDGRHQGPVRRDSGRPPQRCGRTRHHARANDPLGRGGGLSRFPFFRSFPRKRGIALSSGAAAWVPDQVRDTRLVMALGSATKQTACPRT